MTDITMPTVELETAQKYKLKQELDIKKDNWMHFPIYSGIAVYAYDYIEKHRKKRETKKEH
jgi:hypothetical protein